MASAVADISVKFLPFHVPLIEEEEIDAAVLALRSGWLTTGPKVKEFEREFASAVGAEHAIALNSGTAALHLALAAIGLQPEDEVILPTLTFAATAEVVTYFGARPVLVDSVPPYWNLDIEAVERAITPRTKAIIPVHFGGHPCDMDDLLVLARKHNLKVIEDAAHSFPARYRDRPVGSIGDITCFSCYATKSITTGGEGGLAVTDDAEIADKIRIKSLHGISKDAWKRYTPNGSWRYQILEAGYKYNLTDLAASIGLVQLAKAERMRQRRCDIASRYTRNLADVRAFRLPACSGEVMHSWHLYVILTEPEVLAIDRDRLLEKLRARAIGTSVHFIPLHLHPYYQTEWGYRAGDFPLAENYSERCLSLPIYPGMSDDDVDRVCRELATLAQTFSQ